MALPGNPKDVLNLRQWFSNFAAQWNRLGNSDAWLLPQTFSLVQDVTGALGVLKAPQMMLIGSKVWEPLAYGYDLLAYVANVLSEKISYKNLDS